MKKLSLGTYGYGAEIAIGKITKEQAVMITISAILQLMIKGVALAGQ